MSAKMNVEKFIELKGINDLKQVACGQPSKLTFLYFYADWSQDSIELGKVIKEYFEGYLIDCNFGFVDSDQDQNLELCSKYGIENVPTAIMVNSDLEKVKIFDEIDPVTIYEAIEAQIVIAKQNFEVEKVRAFNRLEKLTKHHKVIVFFDEDCEINQSTTQMNKILADGQIESQNLKVENKGEENMSKWLVIFSNGLSLPLLFVEGKLVGDTTQVGKLAASGELVRRIPRECIIGDVEAEYQAIIKEERLILLLTSDYETREKEADRCQECLKTMQLKSLIFRHLDLKGKFTLENIARKAVGENFELPFLYFEGRPWDGGDSLLKKMQTEDLKQSFDARLFREDVYSQIKKLINSYPVFVCIKGTPDEPECGFTVQMIEILAKYNVDYRHFNILEDHLIREKIKEFSNWKTFPQLYVNGELIGGLDIIKELIEEGSFVETIKAAKYS